MLLLCVNARYDYNKNSVVDMYAKLITIYPVIYLMY